MWLPAVIQDIAAGLFSSFLPSAIRLDDRNNSSGPALAQNMDNRGCKYVDPTDQPGGGYVSLVLKKIRAERYSSYNLIDLRLHAIGLYAGQDTSVPEPEGQDGTATDSNDELALKYQQMGLINPPEDLMNEVESWWTGPWPVLHVRIEQTTSEGFTFRYQVARDLLGFSQVEDASLETNSPDDPLENEGYLDALAEDVVQQWFLEQFLHNLVFLTGVGASIACMACEKFPGLWPVAAGLIIAYCALFVIDMAVTINNICEITDNAFNRFWMIVVIGLGLLLTITCLDFIKPGVALSLAEKAASETSGLFARLIHGFTDMSLIFLCIKLLLVCWVFLTAAVFFTYTLLELI